MERIKQIIQNTRSNNALMVAALIASAVMFVNAQYLKNPKMLASKIVESLPFNIPSKVESDGTPVNKSVPDTEEDENCKYKHWKYARAQQEQIAGGPLQQFYDYEVQKLYGATLTFREWQ